MMLNEIGRKQEKESELIYSEGHKFLAATVYYKE